MKTKFALIILIALLSHHAKADDDFIYYLNKQKRPSTVLSPALTPISPATAQSIRETARVINAWNPETNQAAIESVLTKRVQFMGVKEGLTKPSIILIDAALLSAKPEVAKTLLPSIIREYPLTGKKLLESLGLYHINMSDLNGNGDLSSLRNEALNLVKQKYGMGAQESALMPSLLRDWSNIDPTGLSTAMFGPGSYIHDAAADGLFPKDSRSPIMGMTRDDVASCYSRCKDSMVHGLSVGSQTGKYVIGTVGAVGGAVTGGPVGAAAGIAFGMGAGELGGGLVGGAIGWGMCASRSCGDSSPAPAHDSGGSNSGPESGGNAPANDPAPAPSSPSSGDGGHDDPSTSPSDSGGNDGGTAGGGDSCHPGDESCGDAMVNPDADPSDGVPSDTGPSRLRRQARQTLPAWQVNALAPYVNPVRPDDVARTMGFARPTYAIPSFRSARNLK